MSENHTVREVVGAFETPEAFYDTVDQLLSSGFDRAEISMMASQRSIKDKLGHEITRIEEAEDDPTIPRRAYISPDAIGDAQGWLIAGLMYIGAVSAAGAAFASGGALAGAAIAAGLAGGSGAALGSAFAKFVGDRHAKMLHEQIERGGLLLWAHARDPAHEARAIEIMRAHGGKDVHAHDIAV